MGNDIYVNIDRALVLSSEGYHWVEKTLDSFLNYLCSLQSGNIVHAHPLVRN